MTAEVLAKLTSAIEAALALALRICEQDCRLTELAAQYAVGEMAWRDIAAETGLAFSELLAELGRQGLPLPRVTPERRAAQTVLLDAIFQAASRPKP